MWWWIAIRSTKLFFLDFLPAAIDAVAAYKTYKVEQPCIFFKHAHTAPGGEIHNDYNGLLQPITDAFSGFWA